MIPCYHIFMQLTGELVSGGVLVVTLLVDVVLIIWISRISHHYNTLTQGIEQKTLMNVLTGIQKSLAEHEKFQATTKAELHKLKEEGNIHLQSLILKRYNPFSDTGGDQSFILTILDGNRDGVVITSLHSRENTRFYVKSVKEGIGVEHPLSDEEQKMINRKAK